MNFGSFPLERDGIGQHDRPLLKGSFCAASSPTLCPRVVSSQAVLADGGGIEWEGGGGSLELPLQKLRQFVLVAEGRRAGQLVTMPS